MDFDVEHLKTHLTEWVDERVKAAVDEGNKDLMTDLGPKFLSIEGDIADVTDMVSDVSKDVAAVADSVRDVIVGALAPITAGLQGVTDTINRLNPFR